MNLHHTKLSSTVVDHKIKELVATFQNGDQLVLQLQTRTKFASFKEADLFQLTYGERYEGSYYQEPDEPVKPGEHYFMATGTEYFPADKHDEALAAFLARCSSEHPGAESGRGYRLDDFLQKDN